MDFEEVYNTYYKQIYYFVLSLCHHPQTAYDVTDETFYRALKNYENFKGTCKVHVWLCQIAKNIFFTESKKQSKIVDYPMEIAVDELDFTKTIEDKDLSMQIHKILHTLEEPYKEVFTLRIFGELSFRQISELFEKSESWARVTFFRAKNKIVSRLKEVSL